MSALRTFLVEVVGVDQPKAPIPGANGTGEGWDTKQGVATLDEQAEAAAFKAEVMKRLAELIIPFKKAVAKRGPDAPQLESLLGIIKASLVKKQFLEAAEGLDVLEGLLNAMPPGMETGAGADAPKFFEVEVLVANNTKVALNLRTHDIAAGAPVFDLDTLIQPGGSDGCKISDVSNVEESHKIKGNLQYSPKGTEVRWLIHYEFTPDEKDGKWTTQQKVEGSEDFVREKPVIDGKTITFALKQNVVVPPPPPVPGEPPCQPPKTTPPGGVYPPGQPPRQPPETPYQPPGGQYPPGELPYQPPAPPQPPGGPYPPAEPTYQPSALPQPPEGYSPPGGQHPPGSPGYPPQPPQYGGHDVAWLQNSLIKLGYNPGQPDGKWGPKTKSAIQAFQKDRGLKVDGVVGPMTTAALEQGAGGCHSQPQGYPPQQPGYPPQQPGYPPPPSGNPPQQQPPGYQPPPSGYQPPQPGYPPQQPPPGYQPPPPGYKPPPSGYKPRQPGYPPRQPGYPPEENYYPPQEQTWQPPPEPHQQEVTKPKEDDSLLSKAKQLLDEGKKWLED
jgi:peptidoglycan hydrolase-like protein with peptidoglycan-binding domain